MNLRRGTGKRTATRRRYPGEGNTDCAQRPIDLAANGRTKSKTTGLLEDYEKNLRLWPRAIDEAAEQLARQMILYSKTQNQ